MLYDLFEYLLEMVTRLVSPIVTSMGPVIP